MRDRVDAASFPPPCQPTAGDRCPSVAAEEGYLDQGFARAKEAKCDRFQQHPRQIVGFILIFMSSFEMSLRRDCPCYDDRCIGSTMKQAIGRQRYSAQRTRAVRAGGKNKGLPST